jgi:hypothetical protein
MSAALDITSNRLAVLATEIRAAHEDVSRSAKYSAERAVDAGRSLAEAKADESIARGRWERWVEQEAGAPYSTAQRYIQMYVAVSDQALSIEDISEVGQIGALKAVAREIRRREQAEARSLVNVARGCIIEIQPRADRRQGRGRARQLAALARSRVRVVA